VPSLVVVESWWRDREERKGGPHCAALPAAALVCLVLASAAAAAAPLPSRPAGSGRDPLAARALVSGTPVRIRAALVWVDGFGDLSLSLSPDVRSCASLSAGHTSPYVWAWVHSNGPAVAIGRPISGTGKVRTVVNFVTRASRRPVNVRQGIQLVFTRIDTSAHGVWHGRLRVANRRVGTTHFAFSGTFAARWCGKR
jgi:hypothetical protein